MLLDLHIKFATAATDSIVAAIISSAITTPPTLLFCFIAHSYRKVRYNGVYYDVMISQKL
jgi:hypothetical protein